MHGILIDLDGVIYEGERAVSGAAEALSFLQKNQIPHLFVTNTTSRPITAILHKLDKLGVKTTRQQILTPVIAARQWIHAHAQLPAALFVPKATLSDFDDLERLPEGLDTGAACVVIGDIGEAWCYKTLNRAFRLLHDHQPPDTKGDRRNSAECRLIALGMTRYWRAADGLRLDVAPFIKALEYAAGVSAIVLGKPSLDFYQQAANQLEIPLNRLTMIGDDIVSDVGGAQRAGMRGLLVKTGKYRDEDLQGQIVPDAVLSSIAELPEWLSERSSLKRPPTDTDNNRDEKVNAFLEKWLEGEDP